MSERDPAHLLPVEVWHECWKYVDDQTHRNLSVTCHFFRDMCLPWIFNTFVFSTRITMTEAPAVASALLRKAANIEELGDTSHISSSIQHLRYEVNFTSEQLNAITGTTAAGDAYMEVISAFSNTLSKLEHLRKVEIHMGGPKVVHGRILEALARIHHLDELFFSASFEEVVVIDPRIGARAVSFLDTPFPNTEPRGPFQTSATDSQPPFRILLPTSLHSLAVRSRVLCPRLVWDLISQPNDPCINLTKLTISPTIEDTPHVIELFAVCPVLKSLTIEPYLQQVFENAPTIPSRRIRTLEDFSGPTLWATSVVPDRAIRRLAILDPHWGTHFGSMINSHLTVFTEGRGAIQELTLPDTPCRPDVVYAIAEKFPRLKSLSIVLVDDRAVAGTDDGGGDEGDEIPVDANGDPSESPFVYKGIMYRLALGHLHLPPAIEELRLTSALDLTNLVTPIYQQGMEFEPFTAPMARRVVELLSSRYTSLRRVKLGLTICLYTWYRSNSEWKTEKQEIRPTLGGIP